MPSLYPVTQTPADKLPAALYIVATPIGNLDDISQRAIEVLRTVDTIAAEDTRHSRKLLNHLGIRGQLQALHEHNEQAVASRLLADVQQGKSLALVSDAGTPLISDPGYRLVEQAHQAAIAVVPIPGSCAAIAALSVAGLPTDQFLFVGFLPAKQQARLNALKAIAAQPASLVIYESCHRIVDCLEDLCTVLGEDRRMTFTRELTKRFETVRQQTLGECRDWVAADADQRKGEIVMVIAGAEASTSSDAELRSVLEVLLQECPVKQAASIAARLTGHGKNECYQLALSLRKDD